MVSEMTGGLDKAKALFVHEKEKQERNPFGVNSDANIEWPDVELDEIDLGRQDRPSSTCPDGNSTHWEQWAGIVQRGHPKSLRLFRSSQGFLRSTDG